MDSDINDRPLKLLYQPHLLEFEPRPSFHLFPGPRWRWTLPATDSNGKQYFIDELRSVASGTERALII